MNWSTEPPITPGYYWCSNDIFRSEQDGKGVVEVYGFGGDLWIDFGRDCRKRLAGIEAQWYGPLQPPTDADELAQELYDGMLAEETRILDGEVE